MKKNKLLKIIAIAMAAASITAVTGLGASAHTVANTWTVTSETAELTTKQITVKNVKDKSSSLRVVAYQIIKGSYKDGKLTNYVVCDDGIQIADLKEPTASEITAIANQIQGEKVDLTGVIMNANASDTTTFEATVEAGLYVVLVEGSDEVVYNPAIIAVNIDDANTPGTSSVGSSVDMESFFKIGSTTAYLKASSSGLNKTIQKVDGSDDEPEKSHGATAAVGDTVQFKLDEMLIPYYSDDYLTSSLKYEIKDYLETGAFTGVKAVPTVKVAGTAVDPTSGNDKTYTIEYYKDGSFSGTPSTTFEADKYLAYKVVFDPDYIKANGGKSVEVTYQSTIAETAGMNLSENKNTATLTYSNDPTNASSAKTKETNTYHYTFAIGGYIDAENQDTDHKINEKITNEINKVTKSGEWEDSEKTIKGSVTKNPLAGATFTLYSDAGFENVKDTYTTTDDGIVRFEGLDAGTYYLKETNAPENYTLNENDYKIVITPTFNDDGVMASYSIAISYKKGTETEYTPVSTIEYTATAVVADNGDVNYTDIATTSSLAEIVNTNLASLPATGGVGTIVMVVLGAAGMAFFLTMIFVINRKKGKKNEEK